MFDIALRTVAHLGIEPFPPLAGDAGAVFADFQRFRTTEADDPVGRASVLRTAVAANIAAAVVVTLSNAPTETEIANATSHASQAETLIVLTRDASDSPEQAGIASQVIEATPDEARVIHCCMRGPYDAGVLRDVDDYLFTFGDPKVSIDALVAVIMGIPQHQRAQMPVALPNIDALRAAASRRDNS